jgi:methionine-rich copper-binding protein CopC
MHFLLTVALAFTSFFHTELKSSIPARNAVLAKSPAAVTLTFTEGVVVGVSKIAILKSDSTVLKTLMVKKGADAATLTADVPAALPAGKYLVRYSTAADDGHAAKGLIPFSVK